MRDCVRLKSGGVSTCEIARRIGVTLSMARLTCVVAGRWVWPIEAALTTTAAALRQAGKKQGFRRREVPDWTRAHRETKRKHVRSWMIWQKYIGRYRR
jgi:hypothetical protein